MLHRLAFFLPSAAVFLRGKSLQAVLVLLVCFAFCIPEMLEARFAVKAPLAGKYHD
jgi:hypothetical protein